MKINNLRLTLISMALATMPFMFASAQLYWDGTSTTGDADGGDGTWDTTALNWDDAATAGTDVSWTAAESAIFGGTAGIIDLGASVDVTGLTFNTSGYVIRENGSTNTITFSSAGDFNVAGTTATVAAAIAGTNKITKTGAGELQLFDRRDPGTGFENFADANTFSGGFDIAAGRVTIADLGDENLERSYFGASSNTVTFTGNAEIFAFTGTATLAQDFAINTGVTATFVVGDRDAILIEGVLSGDGLLRTQAGSMGGVVHFQNTANTFTGDVRVESGGSGRTEFRVSSFTDTVGSVIELVSNENGGWFVYDNDTNANPLVFNERQIILFGDGNSSNGGNFDRFRIPAIRNDSGDPLATLTINQDLEITGTGWKRLQLGGSNTGDNTIAGAIPDALGDDVLHIYKREGNGKWILAGANTYEGNTNVINGTLVLADTGELRFVIGANGVNNQITGGATISLLGEFVMDLTNASTLAGDSWTIVDVASLNETFGSTFTVSSLSGGAFADNGDNTWSISENGVQYDFSELDGTLTVVPEPSAFALIAGFLGLTWIMLRRR